MKNVVVKWHPFYLGLIGLNIVKLMGWFQLLQKLKAPAPIHTTMKPVLSTENVEKNRDKNIVAGKWFSKYFPSIITFLESNVLSVLDIVHSNIRCSKSNIRCGFFVLACGKYTIVV